MKEFFKKFLLVKSSISCLYLDISYYSQDKLMTVTSESSSGSSGNWLFKNKEHGKASAAASLVLLFPYVLFDINK